MTKRKIKIDVISDVVCPWCYIGKRRLEKAIAEVSDKVDVEIEYHPLVVAGLPTRNHLPN
jgi:predicted DsbA family dithiol-disulfide isomerase